ncbi:hypothetical protein [Rahnella sp. WP5]|uniref:hypothetical protein n=1 Tax=Rahnella sp. WP5 TaxID=1500266 RepID=UPI0012E0617D|nr:hypothetical protein [Rahnella sp. WP5]
MSKIYDNDLQENPAKHSSIWTQADALKVNENDLTTTQPNPTQPNPTQPNPTQPNRWSA